VDDRAYRRKSRKLVAQLSCFLCCLLLAFDNAFAAPMTFKNVFTGGNHCCWWTGAEGEITDETPRDFDRYLNSEKYSGSPIRLNSSGGSLVGALELGAAIRRHGLDTEVGRTSNFDKLPGVCASACAYAFMGDVARHLEEGAKLGVHRFYNKAAIENYSAKQFSAGDLDATQRTFAALVLYLLQMGVKAEVIGLTDQAGPDEMHWISPKEAAVLQVTFDPKAWTPWMLEPYKAGLTASSHSADGDAQATVFCSRRSGGELFLTVKSWDLGYAKQMATCGRDGYHSVFGAKISNQDVDAVALPGGGSALKFKLQPGVPFSDPALFNNPDSYPLACIVGFRGNQQGFAQGGRLALKNCID
jgi:hypothetical protein